MQASVILYIIHKIYAIVLCEGSELWRLSILKVLKIPKKIKSYFTLGEFSPLAVQIYSRIVAGLFVCLFVYLFNMTWDYNSD